jgi:ribonuclease Z
MRQVILLLTIAIALVTAWVATCGLGHFENVAAGIAHLEDRSFDDLTVVTIGTGGPYENPRRRGPCTAIGFGPRVVLVDAGRAVAEGLRAARIPVAQPDTIFVTSLLPEHTVGIDDLLLTGWLARRTKPLRLVGPVGTRALAEALRAAHAQAIDARAGALGLPAAGARFEVREVRDGWSEDEDGLVVRAAALPGSTLPALAYRFEASERSAVVGGSGPATDEIVELARSADLLVHEAFPEGLRREAALHTSTHRVGELALRAGVRTLVLVRLRPPPLLDFQYTGLVGESFPGRVVIASDGDEFTP